MTTKHKLHPKIKQHWKATKNIIRLTLERKNLKCRKCHKKISFSKKEIKCFVDGFKMGKGKRLDTWSEIPIQVLSGLFIHDPFHILCYKCKADVYRFMGVIPDKHDSDTFPQQITSLPDGMDIGDWLSKKTKRWEIHYKKKRIPFFKKTFAKLMKEACKAYIKKYPYIPYNQKQLIKLIKNYKLRDMD